MAATRLTLRHDGTVVWLTLDGAPGNLLTAEIVEQLAGTLADAADAGTRVALLRGAGGGFCRGWAAQPAGDATLTAALQAIAEAPLPVIALLEGDVFGAGLSLALVADIRLAAAGARFGFPEEVREGVLPVGGSVARLARLVGGAQALHMLLTGEPVDEDIVLRCGLVSATLPGSEELAAEGARLAAVIAARGPIAERYAKEAVNRGLEMPLEQALRYETDLTVILQSTADRAEGVRAFAEKRPPRFHGA